jgi:hypothetical protein
LLLAGCQPTSPVCPPTAGTPQRLAAPPPTALPATAPDQDPAPMQVEIGGDLLAVDQIVSGPLCNGAWSGTVYVTCDVQVLPWEEQPTFLEDCDLSIAPDTVVYVAYHNDTPYYNGCSCHTGEISQP